MPINLDHHEFARTLIRTYGAHAGDVSRRRARLNRSAAQFDFAACWDAVAEAIDGILAGHRPRRAPH
jgi:hypothetical protein